MQTIRKDVDLGLLLIRLALGIVFVMHGWQKVAGIGFDGFTEALASLGVPFPALNAAIVIAVELGGGLAMLTGVLVRPIGLLIAFVMIVAAATVHLKNGFFLPAGYEFTLVLMLASLAMSAAGAGAYSLDAWLFRSTPARVDAARERIAA